MRKGFRLRVNAPRAYPAGPVLHPAAPHVKGREIAGQFFIEATARPDTDLKTVEKAIDEELARLLTDGLQETEVERVVLLNLTAYIEGLERIGRYGGKSELLATGQVLAGNPPCRKEPWKRIQDATPRDLLQAARAWLSDGDYTLEVQPFGKHMVSRTEADHSQMPQPGAPPQVRFPSLEKASLSNGIKVVLARNTAVPVVTVNLLLDAGYAVDQTMLPGAAKLAMNLLRRGTTTRSSLEIGEQLDLLGTRLKTSCMR